MVKERAVKGAETAAGRATIRAVADHQENIKKNEREGRMKMAAAVRVKMAI